MKKTSQPESLHIAAATLSPALRRYLFGTTAVTGAAIMIIEILGAKMLAPYVGTSHFVWTAQIAVTLLALAAGYFGGGWWADRAPKLNSLFLGIMAAALYLCVAATQAERVAYACLRFSLPVGSLLASAFLFFVPLALLATAGPFLVRRLTASVQDVGGSMGRLAAISTLGSFVGTILIGYVLIPLLPNSLTMTLTSIMLLLVAGGHFVFWGCRPLLKWISLLALIIGFGCVAATASQRMMDGRTAQEIYRRNSNFGQLQVFQLRNTQRRAFFNDYLEQGAYDTQSKESLEMFSYMLHDLSHAYATNLNNVLCIGLGVGIVPMQFAREGAQVDVVEINPAVVPLAQQFFDFQPDKMNLTLGDGRQFVNHARKQFDAIILDACLGDSQPSHLMTREAFTAMRRLLRPKGVLVINCFGNFAPGRDFMIISVQKTLTNVFSSVRTYADSSPEGFVNVFFVASPTELRLQHPPTFDHVHPVCRSKVEAAFSRTVKADTSHGIILTDDYNPIEYYDADNREHFRREQAQYLREL